MTRSLQVAVIGAALAAAFTLAACEHEGPAERAGKQVDKAVDGAGDAVKDAGDKVKDAVDK
jgi:hypothetical protein